MKSSKNIDLIPYCNPYASIDTQDDFCFADLNEHSESNSTTQAKYRNEKHKGHTVVESSALNKKFFYCRNCKEEV